ncbi:MAG: acetoin:2,6-dichlorophenolindophenol oxidoreductase subunit alpha [Solirubrobacteraceae bacterium]
MAKPDLEALAKAHAQMALIRRFEEAADEQHAAGLVPGPLHLSIGQEAVAVGVCAALREDDVLTSTHRGHHHCLAKGVDPKRMMAELLGRQDGWALGRGGSMHIVAPEVGVLGTNGIVGGGLPIAVGAAYGFRAQDHDRIAVCFFGEGAAATGAFGEALNLAGLWRLPVVFVCENNQYVELGPQEHHVAGRIADRAAGYGFGGEHVDGNGVEAVCAAAGAAVVRARAGEGPTLVEALTYRWRGHHADDRADYQPEEELEHWRTARDPIALAAQKLSDHVVAANETAAQRAVAAAVEFALASPPATLQALAA